jgi:hypothetical protein
VHVLESAAESSFSRERQPKRGRGRPKGSTNFFTRGVKEAIIDACNELGF